MSVLNQFPVDRDILTQPLAGHDHTSPAHSQAGQVETHTRVQVQTPEAHPLAQQQVTQVLTQPQASLNPPTRPAEILTPHPDPVVGQEALLQSQGPSSSCTLSASVSVGYRNVRLKIFTKTRTNMKCNLGFA